MRLVPHDERVLRQPPAKRDTEILSRLPANPKALAFLVEAAGDHIGRFFPITADVADIGHDERNHIVLAERGISGFHARVRRDQEGRFTLEDQGSTNGARVNGEVVTRPLPMRENDELELGSTTLVIKFVRLRSWRTRRRPSRGAGSAARTSKGAKDAHTNE